MSNLPGGFTVLMSVYKNDKADLFEKAVHSIYSNLTLPDCFILIVDGPIPKPLNKKLILLKRKFNFEYYRLPINKGLQGALNFGLSKIKTKWVFRADADDINHVDRFSTQINFLKKNPEVDLLGTSTNEIDENGSILSKKMLPLDFATIKKYIRFRNPFNHNTVAFKVDCARKVGGYPNLYLKEDYGMWILFISSGFYCLNIPNSTVSATTGLSFFKRRGGLTYIFSELGIQKLLVKSGLSKPFLSCIIFFFRTFIFLLPPFFRALIYRRFLRN
jgi:glycosyltransferase involved in cell wall biosynthesis